MSPHQKGKFQADYGLAHVSCAYHSSVYLLYTEIINELPVSNLLLKFKEVSQTIESIVQYQIDSTQIILLQ